MPFDYFFYSTKSNVNSIKVFGCFCFIDKHNIKQHKLELRLEFGIYQRIDDVSKDYKVYPPTHCKIQITCNVLFDETYFLNLDPIMITFTTQNLQSLYSKEIIFNKKKH